MRIFINFNGVLDHLDILNEEASRGKILMSCVQNLYQLVPDDNYELVLQMKNIINSIDLLQRNIQGRKDLLSDIVYELKRVNQSGKNTVAEIEYMINELSNEG